MLAGLVLLAAAACTASGPRDGGRSPELVSASDDASDGPSAGCGPGNERLATGRHDVRSGGEDRLFQLTVPEPDADVPAPMIVSLHGATGTSADHDAVTGFPALALREGAVILTPEAAEPGRIWRVEPQSKDIRFVVDLVHHVARRSCVDLGRVHLAGFSMGGMFSMALACAAPERFASIGVVSGLVDVPCAEPRSMPLVAVHGGEDAALRVDGTYGDSVRLLFPEPTRSRAEVARAWAGDDGCDTDAPQVLEGDGITTTTYRCPDGGEVTFHLLVSGSHRWPRAPVTGAGAAGQQGAALDATQVLWEFFTRARP